MPVASPSTVDTSPTPPQLHGTPGPVLLAAAAAGVIAAVVVPVVRPGIGWAVMAVAVAAIVAVTARARQPHGQVQPLWAATTVALLAVGAVRASEWLFVLCALTACCTASLAMAGGRSARELAVGAVAVPLASVRELPWAARGVGAQTRRGGGTVRRTAAAATVALGLLAVFGMLLATADAAFAGLLVRLIPAVEGPSATRSTAAFVVITLGVLGACSVLSAPRRLVRARPTTVRQRLRRHEWAMPVLALVALFAVFVSVQLAYLFGGRDLVLRTAGLTSAEYARRGFWQLCAVTVLTLVVIGVVASHARTESAADRWWLRMLLGSLTILTLVIVGSAMSRMWAYQQAYGFTVLRVLVSACEIWLGMVYLMVLAAGVRLRAGWLPRAVVATAVAWLLAIAALDPDRFIADRNIDRWQHSGRIDLEYIGRLSADTAPALQRLPQPLRSCANAALARNLAQYADDDWRGWNLGRDHARHILANAPEPSTTECVR